MYLFIVLIIRNNNYLAEGGICTPVEEYMLEQTKFIKNF